MSALRNNRDPTFDARLTLRLPADVKEWLDARAGDEGASSLLRAMLLKAFRSSTEPLHPQEKMRRIGEIKKMQDAIAASGAYGAAAKSKRERSLLASGASEPEIKAILAGHDAREMLAQSLIADLDFAIKDTFTIYGHPSVHPIDQRGRPLIIAHNDEDDNASPRRRPLDEDNDERDDENDEDERFNRNAPRQPKPQKSLPTKRRVSIHTFDPTARRGRLPCPKRASARSRTKKH